MPYAPRAALIAARLAAGLTRNELAAVLGITPRALSFYENGRETPSMPLAQLWVKALGKHGSMEFWRRNDDPANRGQGKPVRPREGRRPTMTKWLADDENAA